MFCVVSTVLRVRCYLHLRWYYSKWKTFDTVNFKLGGAAAPAYLWEGLPNMHNDKVYSKQAPDEMQMIFKNRSKPIWSRNPLMKMQPYTATSQVISPLFTSPVLSSQKRCWLVSCDNITFCITLSP